MKQAVVYVGIDISKKELELAWEGRSLRHPNDAPGIRAVLRELRAVEGAAHVVVEASGGYERALVAALQEGALAVSVVQAGRVRQFARAARHPGQDRLDRCRGPGALWSRPLSRPRAHCPPRRRSNCASWRASADI